MQKKKSYLSVFQMTIMTTITVASLRGLPAMAIEGKASIIMYLVPAILFLVPTALVGAELASTYQGGIYVWVKEAFGNKWGFLAIWLQWIQNVVWYPIQLAFVAAALAFAIGRPDLSNSGLFTTAVIIIVYWLATFLSLQGGNLFAKVSSYGGMIGTIIPAVVLIFLGGMWLATGEPISHSYTESSFLPKVTGIGSLVLIINNVLAYAGMEVNAVHVDQMRNPKKDYTKSVFLAVILIMLVFIIPTLTISIAIPKRDLGLDNGIMVAFSSMFERFGVGWLGNVFAGAIFIGAIASVITWVSGPSKGLLAAGRTGLLPPLLQKKNKHDVQVGILILQGLIVTALAMIYALIPDVSEVFLALVGMAAALYLIMYVLMYAAAIILRKKNPKIKRGYSVPALPLVAGIGLIACVLAFVVSFFPAQTSSVIPSSVYTLVVLAVVVILGIPPLVFYALRKPNWDRRTEVEKQATARLEELEEEK
ncbi:amino acid permease [Streptococcus thermophilus]|nr:amino acid permease [Streptococcus thermophilus]